MDHIKIETDQNGIASLVLDRPKVNAMNSLLLTEIRDAFHQLADDDGVRGVLVTGHGKCLSAGLDLSELMSLQDADAAHFLRLVDEAFDAAFRFVKPMAVAVRGHAIAGGMILALCADHLVMAEGDYKLGLTELAVGVPLPRVAFEVARCAMDHRAWRKLVFGAGLHRPAEVFAMGIGDELSDDPQGAAQRWLETTCSRHIDTFRFVKTLGRKEAFERIDALAAPERDRLAQTLIAARNQG
jgi:enoyl-CoA hydratase